MKKYVADHFHGECMNTFVSVSFSKLQFASTRTRVLVVVINDSSYSFDYTRRLQFVLVFAQCQKYDAELLASLKKLIKLCAIMKSSNNEYAMNVLRMRFYPKIDLIKLHVQKELNKSPCIQIKSHFGGNSEQSKLKITE